MITIVEIEKPRQEYHQWYKYLILTNCFNYAAYNTDKWFNDFISRHNIDLNTSVSQERVDSIVWKVKTHFIDKVIFDHYFWDVLELPKGAKVYKWLCNWSIVDCYYLNIWKTINIYRPNPNATNVYNPLSIEDHISFHKIRW